MPATTPVTLNRCQPAAHHTKQQVSATRRGLEKLQQSAAEKPSGAICTRTNKAASS